MHARALWNFSGEIPSITVSGASEEPEPAPEASSGECMGPPSVAGTSMEPSQASEQSEDMLEGEDGVIDSVTII